METPKTGTNKPQHGLSAYTEICRFHELSVACALTEINAIFFQKVNEKKN